MLSLLGNQMRHDLNPTDFELIELQAELDAENEATQNDILSDCFGDDYADAMMKELGCVSTHLGI